LPVRARQEGALPADEGLKLTFEVGDVVGIRGMLKDLVDGGQEVVQGADLGKSWAWADGSSGGSEDECGADDPEGYTAAAQFSRQASVLPAGAFWGSGQRAVDPEDSLEIDAFLVRRPNHFFFLLAAASFWLSCLR
jgi:hypothetical protein